MREALPFRYIATEAMYLSSTACPTAVLSAWENFIVRTGVIFLPIIEIYAMHCDYSAMFSRHFMGAFNKIAPDFVGYSKYQVIAIMTMMNSRERIYN